jgi:hypothetical protein
MIERHALWSSIAANRGANADTPSKREALARWNIVTVCERFGWTPDYVASLPQAFLDDLVEINSIQDHYASKATKR